MKANNRTVLKEFLAKRANLTFSEKVWQACYRVPKGKVATYAVIAKMIGKPKSMRAVGNALNKNPYAPEVPCHRIVRSDGSVGGFASGSPKKMKLLAGEGVAVAKGRVEPLEKFLYKNK